MATDPKDIQWEKPFVDPGGVDPGEITWEKPFVDPNTIKWEKPFSPPKKGFSLGVGEEGLYDDPTFKPKSRVVPPGVLSTEKVEELLRKKREKEHGVISDEGLYQYPIFKQLFDMLNISSTQSEEGLGRLKKAFRPGPIVKPVNITVPTMPPGPLTPEKIEKFTQRQRELEYGVIREDKPEPPSEFERKVTVNVEQPVSLPSRLGNAALGSVQMGFALPSGIVEGGLGVPVQETLRELGAPEDVSEFTRRSAEAAAYLLSPGQAIKKAALEAGGPGLKALMAMSPGTRAALGRQNYTVPMEIAEEVAARTKIFKKGSFVTYLARDDKQNLYIPMWKDLETGFGGQINELNLRPPKGINRLATDRTLERFSTKLGFKEIKPGLLKGQKFQIQAVKGIDEPLQGMEPPVEITLPEAAKEIKKLPEKVSGGMAGECFRNALKWAMDFDDETAKVVHGRVKSPLTGGEEIHHAWVETQGKVIDPTIGLVIDKADYFRMTGAKDTVSYFTKEAAENLVKEKNWGPWVTPPLTETIKKLPASGKYVYKAVNRPEVTAKITEAIQAMSQGIELDNARRLVAQVSEMIDLGELPVANILQNIPSVAAQWGVAPENIAKVIADTASTAGKTLNTWSRLAKQLGFAFEKNPAARKIFDEMYAKHKPESALWEKMLDGLAYLEDVRRGLLVTQLATTMRNIGSTAGNLALKQLDDSIQQVILGTAHGLGLTNETYEGINLFKAAYNRLTTKGRADLERILKDDANTLYRARLNSRDYHEGLRGGRYEPVDNIILARAAAAGRKTVGFLNLPNRLQDELFRKIAFEARMRQLLKKTGQKFESVNPKEIPREFYEDSLNYALHMTFSAPPTTQTGREILRAFQRIPIFTTIQPFPRFTYANAIPFFLEHSPLGFMTMLGPKSVKALQSGNPEIFARAASRAAIGTALFKSAWEIRQSPLAGEKWDQIKLNEYEENGKKYTRYFSAKAYAPFSLYLWAAEALLHPERMTGKDWAEAVIGLNKISGTGLVFIDIARAKNAQTLKDYMLTFGNAYLGSYTVPARTAKDIVAGSQKEESYTRFLKENAKYGPFAGAINNIPYMSRDLPISNNPLEPDPNKVIDAWGVPSPIMRQFSGISFTRKNEAQKEIDRLGLDWGVIYPKTKIPEVNNEVAGIMAPIAEKVIPNIVQRSRTYREAPIELQRIVVGGMMKFVKNMSLAAYKVRNPRMALNLEFENLSYDERTVLKQFLPPWVWDRMQAVLGREE